MNVLRTSFFRWSPHAGQQLFWSALCGAGFEEGPTPRSSTAPAPCALAHGGLSQAALVSPWLIWQTFHNICSQLNQEPETVRDRTRLAGMELEAGGPDLSGR